MKSLDELLARARGPSAEVTGGPSPRLLELRERVESGKASTYEQALIAAVDRGDLIGLEELREGAGFIERLAKRTQRLAERGVHRDRLTAYIVHHQKRWAAWRQNAGATPAPSPPCKHWREKLEQRGCDSSLLAELDRLWLLNVAAWALQHPYLASPLSSCECHTCAPPPEVPLLPPRERDRFDLTGDDSWIDNQWRH